MWNLESCNFTNFPLKAVLQRDIHIAADDVVFVAAIRRVQSVHLKETSFVRCFHLTQEPNSSFICFHMDILEASCISNQYPNFDEEGIMGRWKLVAPKHNVDIPRISLLHYIDDAIEFVKEVQSLENPEWIRRSYLHIIVS